MKALVQVAVVSAMVLAALGTATSASARQSCNAGTFGKGAYHRYCGPAHALLIKGPYKYPVKGGSCTVSNGTWQINVGVHTLLGKSKRNFLSITIFSEKPGTYTQAIVLWQVPGKSGTISANIKVTLNPGMKSGTFSGKNFHAPGKTSGTFSCG